MNQLAPILKKARQALNLTQEDVAKRLGISQRAYSFYEDENLERMPRAKRLEELGKVLNIPIKTVLKYYNGGLEEETTIAEQGKPNQHPSPLLTGATITLQDYINELKESRDRWYNLASSILGEMAEDQRAALAYQKAWIEYEAEKAAAGDDNVKAEVMYKMSMLVRGYLKNHSSSGIQNENDKNRKA